VSNNPIHMVRRNLLRLVHTYRNRCILQTELEWYGSEVLDSHNFSFPHCLRQRFAWSILLLSSRVNIIISLITISRSLEVTAKRKASMSTIGPSDCSATASCTFRPTPAPRDSLIHLLSFNFTNPSTKSPATEANIGSTEPTPSPRPLSRANLRCTLEDALEITTYPRDNEVSRLSYG
jgi:hypothetical protein